MAFEGLSEKLQNVMKKLSGRGKLSEADVKAAMREVRLALLEADVNYLVVKDFVKKVSERAVGGEVLSSLTPGQQVIKIVNEELTALMGKTQARINYASAPPTVIMLVGLQGAGKTTMAAKLGLNLKKQGKKPLIAACDVYRPAAIDQLKIVAEKAGVPVFEQGQDQPVRIAEGAKAECQRLLYDTLIIDTAGRLQIDQAMMDEVKAIRQAVGVHEVMLVLDAMTGQEAVNVASSFNEQVGVDSVILTKLDGDTRGGAALSLRAVTGKPIKFCGVGEKLEDFEPFYPDRMANRILGMGDMLSLIEQAQANFDEEQAIKMEKKLRTQQFDLEDFLEQFQQVRKMGGVADLIKKLPGGLANKVNADDVDERQIYRMEAIIRSMTPQERRQPEILGASRKKRIAAGSGCTVQQVNQLLKQFDGIKKMMKQFGGMGGKRRKFRGLPF